MKRKSIIKLCLTAIMALLTAQGALAQNNYSTAFVAISNLVFYSASDDIYPQYDGTVVVLFAQPVTWRYGSTCATTVVAIRSADKTLMTGVQAALATGRPIQVFVDDAQTVDGIVCYLRALEM
jgi:hypothetical protein